MTDEPGGNTLGDWLNENSYTVSDLLTSGSGEAIADDFGLPFVRAGQVDEHGQSSGNGAPQFLFLLIFKINIILPCDIILCSFLACWINQADLKTSGSISNIMMKLLLLTLWVRGLVGMKWYCESHQQEISFKCLGVKIFCWLSRTSY